MSEPCSSRIAKIRVPVFGFHPCPSVVMNLFYPMDPAIPLSRFDPERGIDYRGTRN